MTIRIQIILSCRGSNMFNISGNMTVLTDVGFVNVGQHVAYCDIIAPLEVRYYFSVIFSLLGFVPVCSHNV